MSVFCAQSQKIINECTQFFTGNMMKLTSKTNKNFNEFDIIQGMSGK